MSDQKRFALNTARDLLEKLDWEMAQYDQFPDQQKQVASYRAFNCAVTIWSICDWVWNSASEDLQTQLRKESPRPTARGSEPLASLLRQKSRELAICQQLANGAKHFLLERYDDKAVSSERLAAVSLFVSNDGKEQRAIPTQAIFISDGSRLYSAIGLFSRARNFWYEFFEYYHIE